MKRFKSIRITHNERCLEDKLYLWGMILFPFFMVLFWSVCTYEPKQLNGCILYNLFGMYCPGCGGTRAVKALCKGKLLTAFWYHPLVPYAALVYMAFMLSHTWERLKLPCIKGMEYRDLYAYVAIGILIVNFVLKNILVIFFKITM